MIQILVDYQSLMVFQGGNITKGIFPEADPNTELYKIINDEGIFYAVTSGFVLYDVERIPTEHPLNEYSYTPSEGFIWHKPPKSQEEIDAERDLQITDLQNAVVELYEMIIGE